MVAPIDCTQFRRGKCLHQAAPRSFFGTATCILDNNPDVRIMTCALRVTHTKPLIWPSVRPPPPPAPPPLRRIREGVGVDVGVIPPGGA